MQLTGKLSSFSSQWLVATLVVGSDHSSLLAVDIPCPNLASSFAFAVITALIILHFGQRLPCADLICSSNNQNCQLLSVIWMFTYLVAVEFAAIKTSSFCLLGNYSTVSGLCFSIVLEHPYRWVFHLVGESTKADSVKFEKSTPSWHHQRLIFAYRWHSHLPDSTVHSQLFSWSGWCIIQGAPADY